MTNVNQYRSYPAILTETDEQTHEYHVTFPDVPSATGYGIGITQAIINGAEELEIALLKLNYFPKSSPLNQVRRQNPDQIVTYIVADMVHAHKLAH